MTFVAPEKDRLRPWDSSPILRPRIIALVGATVLVLLGWLYLGLMVAQMVPVMDMSEAGPGMGLFNQFSQWAELDDFGRSLLASICGPVITSLTGTGAAPLTTFSIVVAMWIAMSAAMMVPSAVPMIAAYAQICETAAAKSISTVSPLVLMAGYLTVWVAFSIVAAAAQTSLMAVSLVSPAMVATHQGLAGILLIFAGLYQFSRLKQACLVKCQSPLPFFFANWSDQTKDIFKLGLRQGAFCLGCCWALMLVMFATGVMNIIWMVILSVLMVAEKTVSQSDLLRRITGFALIIWGVVLTGAIAVF